MKSAAWVMFFLLFLVGFCGVNASQRIVVAEMHTNTG